MPRRIPAILLLLLLAAVSACSAPARHDASAPSSPRGTPATSPGPDPKTAAALIRIAQVFNTDYGNNIDGPVWDRWDARSQAVISRADYIRRHVECSAGPQPPAHVESATPGPHGAWLVGYEISGIQFTDYWYYVNRRWVFDLILSNPAAAQQYRLPFAQYAAATGCNTH
jgi:hypothetical protein